MAAFAAADVGALDQFLGQLGRSDPDPRSEAGILVSVLGLEPSLAHTHRRPSHG
jgi:hypothetical protein